MAILTAGLAVAMLAVPPLISWLNRSNGPLGTIAQSVGFGGRPVWSLPTLAALISAVAAVAKYAHAGLAKWSAMAGAAQSQSAPQPGLLAKLGTWLRQRLMPWVASAVIVLFGFYLALLWTTDGVRAGFSKTQLWYVLGALAIMLFTRIGVNINRLSMHNFYRWRLADAFAVTRQAAEARNLAQARTLFNEASATRFSELRAGPGRARDTGAGDLRHGQHQRRSRGAAGPGRVLHRHRRGARDAPPGTGPEAETRCQRTMPRRSSRPEGRLRAGHDVGLRGSHRCAPVHPVRRDRDQRRSHLASDGGRDAARLPHPVHLHQRLPRRVAAAPERRPPRT